MPYKDPNDPRKKDNGKLANARYRAKRVDQDKLRARQYHAEHREEINRRRKRNGLLKFYNLSLEDYDRMFVEQGGCCAICGRPETVTRLGRVLPLAVDHDHVTGSVRGLLCANHNGGLGMFQDDVATLSKAIAYLEKHRGR